ncbi:MAG: hypothetical protein PHV20_13220 [Bacteroidales bacterium]|nr:hypothetical protein [Bacteroidales bacterium]
MRRYVFILLVNLIAINSFSNVLIGLSGNIIFNETYEKLSNISINITSLDLSHDSTIYSDNTGFYKVILPKNKYILTITNDSLISVSLIDLKETKSIDLTVYYNYMHDYKIFKNGFEKIFTSKNSITLGLESNGKFRRTTFVGIYAAYSFTENGLFEIKGDTLITKTQSIDCYNNMNMNLIGHIDYYTTKQDSIDYLIDKNNIRYNLIQFKALEKDCNKQ